MDAYDIARFWSKVNVKVPTKCWPWLGAATGDGYGQFRASPELGNQFSHRVAYALFAGVSVDSMAGLVVRHACDNPICCNPFHLSTGTHADNVKDRVNKDRSAVGEQNGRHVLTEEDIPKIRADQRPLKVIAAAYGVTHWTIQAIKYRRSWKHVPD